MCHRQDLDSLEDSSSEGAQLHCLVHDFECLNYPSESRADTCKTKMKTFMPSTSAVDLS